MLGLEPALVEAVLDDWRTADIDNRLRAALDFLEKLTLTPGQLGKADMQRYREAGLSHDAIREAAYVAFLFSVMDRLADAFDFEMPNESELGATGDFLYNQGYKLTKLIR